MKQFIEWKSLPVTAEKTLNGYRHFTQKALFKTDIFKFNIDAFQKDGVKITIVKSVLIALEN